MSGGWQYICLDLLKHVFHVCRHFHRSSGGVYNNNRPIQAGKNTTRGVLKAGFEVHKSDRRLALNINVEITRDLRDWPVTPCSWSLIADLTSNEKYDPIWTFRIVLWM